MATDTPEKIAVALLATLTQDKVIRDALVFRLTQIISLAESWKAGKFLSRPPNPAADLDSLGKALLRVLSILDKLDPSALRKVNRPLHQSDIPLLDCLHEHIGASGIGAPRTTAPIRIAEVLHHLTGKLLEHIDTIEVKPSARGSNPDFSRFLADQLAFIYEAATGQPVTRCVDRDTGKSYGAFFDFVALTLSKAHIRRPSAAHIVELATRIPVPD